MIDTEILEDYSSEARELLDEMDHSLMRLEKEGPVPELLNNVFRAVHCIKGSAQYIGLESSSTLTHGVENLLDRLREGVLTLDATTMEFLFRAKDLISTLIEEVSQHRAEKSDISTMMEALDAILQRGPTTPDIPVAQQEVSPVEEEVPTEWPPPIVTAPDEEVTAIFGPDDRAALESDDAGILEPQAFDAPEDLEDYSSQLKSEAGELDEELLGAEEDALYEPMSYVVREFDEEPEEEAQTPAFFSVTDMEEAALDTHEAEAEEAELEAEEGLHELLEAEADEREFEHLEAQEAVDAESFVESTIPHILTISLYLDDLQDGFFQPSEIAPSLIETIEVIREAVSVAGLDEAGDILLSLRNRLVAIEPDSDALQYDEIEEMRGLLHSLKPFYPEDRFPLADREFTPSEPIQEEAEAAVPESPLMTAEREVEPEAEPAMAAAPVEEAPAAEEAPVAGIQAAPAGTTTVETTLPEEPEEVLSLPSSADRSMMADVDDELLSEFQSEFEAMFKQLPAAAQPGDAEPVSALADGLDVSAEDSDREIIEIFLAYGLEIMEKLEPLVDRITSGQAGEGDLEACSESINSIRSSATYMDYQKLASFLDDWYENTRSAADRLDSVSAEDLAFMDDNFKKFQLFLRDLQRALTPGAVPAEPVSAPVQQRPAPEPPRPAEAKQPPAPAPAPPPPVAAKPAAPPMAAATPKTQPAPEAPIPAPPAALPVPAAPSAPAAQEAAQMMDAVASRQEPLTGKDLQEGAVVKTMRVDSAKVDTLLNQVGELVVNRSYVEQLALELKSFHRLLSSRTLVGKREIQSVKDLALKVGEASIALGRVATDIQEGVMKLRMLPVGQLFNRMPRLIRDLSRRVGKVVNLEVHGADTEVDKRVIEQIYNPLVHLIRNAVDHGIEDKETRKNSGKPEEGVIVLRAYSQGNQVSIDVEDDGGGIDSKAVVEKAVEQRLIDTADTSKLSSQDIYNFLFYPGFSTSKAVTRTSGRGVGMDVVKKDVEKINGHVDVESWENEGTRISIKIPLTLAIIQTLLIRSLKHVFAIPLTSVREIIQISPHEITTIEGFEVIKFRDETIPVLRINEVFHLKQADQAKQPRFLVLATAGSRTVGFLVEELIGEQDVVIKPLADHVFKNRGLAGSTILGDGTIALVLDVSELIEDIIAQQRQLALQSVRNASKDSDYEMKASLEM